MASLVARRASDLSVLPLEYCNTTPAAAVDIERSSNAHDIVVDFTDTSSDLAAIEDEERPQRYQEECTEGSVPLMKPPFLSEDATDDILDGAKRLLAERDSNLVASAAYSESCVVLPKFTSLAEALEATIEASGATSLEAKSAATHATQFQPKQNPMVSGLVSMMQAAAMAALEVRQAP